MNRLGFLLPLETEAMECRTAAALPAGEDWQYEPKWDGFRCLAFKTGGVVELMAKSGKSLSRYFPELQAALAASEAGAFVLDGEIMVPVDGLPSFAALQARVHPAASRIRKLAAEIPALLVAFDCLATVADGSLLGRPLGERRAALARLGGGFGRAGSLSLSPATTEVAVAARWLAEMGVALDGIVAKRTGDVYAPGQRRMVKVKRIRTADCVVGGYRYAKGSRAVGSLLLGLFNDEGLLDHIGFTSAISNAERPALTRRLEALRGGDGFTGNAPGGPSRWSDERSTAWERLRPELVVEVGYDHVTDGRFRHGTQLLRWRPDKAPRQCDSAQIAPVGDGRAGRLEDLLSGRGGSE